MMIESTTLDKSYPKNNSDQKKPQFNESKCEPSPLIQEKFNSSQIGQKGNLSIDSGTETESFNNPRATLNIDLDFNLYEHYDLENRIQQEDEF